MTAEFDNSFANLGANFGTHLAPQPLDNPALIHLNRALVEALELPATLVEQLVLGQSLPTECTPFAMVYAGHQFGGFSPQLGDGRGLLLGEWRLGSQRWDLHLKGAGRTPYSRFGDGRAVLRSSIREYLGSCAMAGLGIPTTQALALAGSSQQVVRESLETGATLLRASRCHIRFGHFEYFFYQNQTEPLRQLIDYCAQRYLQLQASSAEQALALLTMAVTRTAHLIARWQAAGFAHGVMNTDNMSLIGETFDFGPFGFLDDFEPGFICNHSDDQGRYAFDRQPNIGLWNLNALAHSLSGFIAIDDIKTQLARYAPQLTETYNHLMAVKLGLIASTRTAEPNQISSDHQQLLADLLALLAAHRIDYHGFMRTLSHDPELACDMIPDSNAATSWLTRYRALCLSETARQSQMLTHNPKFVLRNYLAQRAIESAQAGDYGPLTQLFTVLTAPFDEHPELAHLAQPPSEDQKHLPVSCSS